MSEEKKTCSTCEVEKSIDSFYFIKNTNSYRNQCKLCVSDRKKQYYKDNKEKVCTKTAEYRQNNKEKIGDSQAEYRQTNIETRRERPKSAPYLRLKNIQGTTIGKIWKKFFQKKIFF